MSLKQPVRYDPSVEQVKSDERETIEQLEGSFKQILDTTFEDYGHAVRSVHAKGHGIVKGTLTVADGLAPELAQGLFARPGRYEALLRISTNPGDILDDSISVPRGAALKVLGVEGERLPGSEGDATQDFIMANAPAFSAPDAPAFAKNLKLLAATTDRAEGGKKLLSGALQTVEAALETVGVKSPTVATLGGAPNVHPLGETYWSQTPFRHGDHIAKYQLVPVSAPLTDLTGDKVNTSGRPDALREVVGEVMATQGGTWELRAQLNRDLEAMPIEDGSVEWKEEDSPYQTVATLSVEPQASWVHGESDQIESKVAFNVWHGLAAHRPLGNLNRARNETYKLSADYRGTRNGCPMHEPRALAELEATA